MADKKKAKKATTAPVEPKAEPKKEKAPTAAPESFTPWTVDLRGRFGDNVTKEDIKKVADELRTRGRKIETVYVRRKQKDSVKKVIGSNIKIVDE